ncbi:MAG: class I SAM-dependent methyltransferase [Synergistaceae bacterium]|jgi:SAM-dependent methyltransferase|nr:class I SAM-dependent methyltransferase [Synergistaceae bacterium]
MFKILKKIVMVCLPYGIIMLVRRYLRKFPGSREYWESRYAEGGNSGAGSYNKLAEFKAEIINNFVKENCVQTVIEFGCGDGNQLSLAHYQKYTGFDVSETAITLCKKRFKGDNTKTFRLLNGGGGYNIIDNADLVLSLDVIYHLIENSVFEVYMECLFRTSTKFVIIYACDYDDEISYHVKPRKFTKYIEEKIKGWALLEHIPNKYPHNENDPQNTSWSEFYIYTKIKE